MLTGAAAPGEGPDRCHRVIGGLCGNLGDGVADLAHTPDPGQSLTHKRPLGNKCGLAAWFTLDSN